MKLDVDAGKQILFFAVAFLALLAAGIFVWPFVPALLWGAVFSILLYPLYKKMIDRKMRPTFAALMVTLVPALLIIVPLVIFGSIAGVQVVQFVTNAFDSSSAQELGFFNYIGGEINKIMDPILNQIGVQPIDFIELLRKNQNEITDGVSGPLSTGLKSFVITIATLVISLIATFFMIRDSHHMVEPFTDLIPLPHEETKKILANLSQTVRAVFTSIFVTSLIQGGLAGIAYWVLGVPNAITWTLVTVIACMIPLVGAPVVYIPIAISLIVQGHVVQGVILICVGVGIISQIDQFLRSYFIGTGTKIHQMAIFISLLGGVLVMGPVGLMVGPMLLTLLLGIIDVMRTRQKLEGADSEPGSDITPEPV